MADNVIRGTAKCGGMIMDYACFGHGATPFVILPGISIGYVTDIADAVRASYSVFEEDYTVWLFDRKRNMEKGYSVPDMARDTAAAMRILGISDACVFGASQGGMITLFLAAYYPSLVKKAVISSSCLKNNETTARTITALADLAGQGDVRSLNRIMNKYLFTDGYLEKYAEAFAAVESSGTKETLERFVIMAEAVNSFDGAEAAPLVNCPVLVTGTNHDDMLGHGSAEELAGAIGCECVLYDGYRHALYDEAPDHKSLIKAFFEK